MGRTHQLDRHGRGGFVLLTIWVSRGGMQQREGGRIRPALILNHFGLAAIGLVLWIVYVVNDSDTLAWIAFALLVVVAVLGWTMFAIWWRRRQLGAAAGAVAEPDEPAEQHSRSRLWRCRAARRDDCRPRPAPALEV